MSLSQSHVFYEEFNFGNSKMVLAAAEATVKSHLSTARWGWLNKMLLTEGTLFFSLMFFFWFNYNCQSVKSVRPTDAVGEPAAVGTD